MRIFADLGNPARLAVFAVVLAASAFTVLEACSSDDCQASATCGGAGATPVDGAVGSDSAPGTDASNTDGGTPLGPLTVQLTPPATTSFVILGAKTEVEIAVQRSVDVGAFTITASGAPDGIVVAPVDVAADATTAKVVIDVPAAQAQGPIDGIKLSASVAGGTSLGDAALPIFVRGPSGSLDTTFGRVTGTYPTATFKGAVSQPDGKVVVVAQGTDVSGDVVTRFLSDGGVDPSFGDGGATQSEANFLGNPLLGANGRIYIVVFAGAAALTANGALDATYGTQGLANLGTIDLMGSSGLGPAGTLFMSTLAGPPSNPDSAYLWRLTPGGTVDESYGASGRLIRNRTTAPKWVGGTAITAAPDGTAFVAYAATDSSSVGAGAVTPFDPTGAVGTTTTFTCFNSKTAVIDRGGDGNIVVAAGPTTFGSNVCIHRYSSTLVSDSTFAGTGGVTAFAGMSAFATSVRELANGGVLIAGIAQSPVNQHDEVVLQRFLADGTVDSSYGVNGLVEVPAESVSDSSASMAGAFIQADGSVIAVGTSLPVPGQSRIFRLWP